MQHFVHTEQQLYSAMARKLYTFSSLYFKLVLLTQSLYLVNPPLQGVWWDIVAVDGVRCGWHRTGAAFIDVADAVWVWHHWVCSAMLHVAGAAIRKGRTGIINTQFGCGVRSKSHGVQRCSYYISIYSNVWSLFFPRYP